MRNRFDTYLLDVDGAYELQEVNGVKGILIHAEKETYEYAEIVDILDNAIYVYRRQYGWTVKFVDADGQLKELFTRGPSSETCNYTTRSNQTVQEWVDRLYDKGVKQVSLF